MNVNVNVNVNVIVIGFAGEDDEARFFAIARGAAEQRDAEEVNALLERAVTMLTRMSR